MAGVDNALGDVRHGAARKRASAFGVFNAGYGIMWFAGSWALGSLYDLSVTRGFSLSALALVSVAVQLAAVPVYIYLSKSGMRDQ